MLDMVNVDEALLTMVANRADFIIMGIKPLMAAMRA